MFRRGFAALLLTLSTLLLLPVTAQAGVSAQGFPVAADAEADFVARINALRASKGLPQLEVNGELQAKARAWADTMAGAGRIWHSNLPDGVSQNWRRLGENVGVGPSVGSLQDAFVASPKHYENLVDPGFRYVGVGVVNANGTLYVSEVFMELASQPAPRTSAPAAGTPSSSAAHKGATHKAVAAAPTPPPPPPPPPPSAQLTAVVAKLQNLDL